MNSYFEEEQYNIQWMIYCWIGENEEPYYISKCRTESTAPFKCHNGMSPPADKNKIKTLFKSYHEGEVLDKLDKLIYELGIKDTMQDGEGMLKNSIKHSPYALKERSNGTKIPVDVYAIDGKKVGSYASLGDAVHVLGLNKGNAHSCLQGKFWQTRGYVITFKGEKFRKRPKNGRKRLWKRRKLVAYDSDGCLHFFPSVADAAESLMGSRKKTNSVQRSLISTVDNKHSTKGLCFFEESDYPKFDEIKFATVGRPGEKSPVVK
jgi:hypothetical protein